jgi:hypothetical protein
VTATLRWRAGAIRGHVAADGAYSLEVPTGGRKVKSASFDGRPVKWFFDARTQRVRLDLSGEGYLDVTCQNPIATS